MQSETRNPERLPPQEPTTERKPYRSPRLVSYGDFHERTRASAGPDATEGSSGGSGTRGT